MSFYKPIQWKQGMMLKPHHFQHLDISQRANQWEVFSKNNVFPWGVIKATIDENLISSGYIGLSEFECIFPDGSWVKTGENASIITSDFDSASIFPKSNFMVYAAIYQLSNNTKNVTEIKGAQELNNSITTRYVVRTGDSSENKLFNLYEDDISINAPSLEYAVRIFNDKNISEAKDCLVIPIASLHKNKQGAIVADANYTPPSISIGSAKVIMNCLNDLYIELKKVITQLETYKLQSSGHSTNMSAEELVSYITPTLVKYSFSLQTCSKFISRIKHLINTPKIHPWYAFGALHELASELTSFTVKVSLLSIDVKDHVLSSKYDHFDCAKGILQTKDLIMQLLTEIAVSDEMNVSCERKENSGEFRAVIPERFLSFKSRFYITIITKENPDEWLADFEIYTRIASSITISDIVSRSLPGLSVKHFQDTPPGLPVRQNASYFLVEQSGGVWESVFSSRTAVILWNEAPEDAQIDISVIGA